MKSSFDFDDLLKGFQEFLGVFGVLLRIIGLWDRQQFGRFGGGMEYWREGEVEGLSGRM